MSLKKCSACKEHKPTTEFSRKTDTLLQSKCKACQRAYSKEWYRKNAAKHRANQREYKRANYAAVRAAYKRWQNDNKHIRAANRAARRAAQADRTPVWADRDAIAFIYAESARRSWEEGVEYHVDHIIPLRGEKVSGLHCADNMQITTADYNTGKSNKYDPDEFPEQRHGYPFD